MRTSRTCDEGVYPEWLHVVAVRHVRLGHHDVDVREQGDWLVMVETACEMPVDHGQCIMRQLQSELGL